VAIHRPCYCTREDVCRALDIADTARAFAQVDRLLQAAADGIDADTHRVFYPITETRYKDWPNEQSPIPWRLWLDADQLISLTSLVSGGISLTPGQYVLWPPIGPPYSAIEINLAASAAFNVGATHQRSVALTGTWAGCAVQIAAATSLAEPLDGTETEVDVTNGSGIGVGDLIVVDAERMLVSDRGWLDSGQTLQSPMAASAAAGTVAVTSGSAFARDETLLLDGERMLITDVAGNTLIVKRAWDGSVLAEHTGSTIYASRRLTVRRAQTGTSATTHSDGSTVNCWIPPALLSQLAIAETINAVEQERSAYARVIGSGETATEARGAGLADLRARACTAYARKARTRVV